MDKLPGQKVLFSSSFSLEHLLQGRKLIHRHAKTASFFPKWKGYFSAMPYLKPILPVFIYDNLAYFNFFFAKIKNTASRKTISKTGKFCQKEWTGRFARYFFNRLIYLQNLLEQEPSYRIIFNAFDRLTGLTH